MVSRRENIHHGDLETLALRMTIKLYTVGGGGLIKALDDFIG